MSELNSLYEIKKELIENSINMELINVEFNFNDFKSDWGSDIETMEELENHTTVLRIPESEKFVIQQF